MRCFLSTISCLVIIFYNQASGASCTGKEDIFKLIKQGALIQLNCLLDVKPFLANSEKSILDDKQMKEMESKSPEDAEKEEFWSLEFKDEIRISAAYAAAYLAQFEVLKQLLERGADTNWVNKESHSSVFSAVTSSKHITDNDRSLYIKLLLDYKLNFEMKTDSEGLHNLFEKKDIFSLLTIAYQKNSLSADTNSNETFFQLVTFYEWTLKEIKLFLMLLKDLRDLNKKFSYKPDINAYDEYGMTALHKAILGGNKKSVNNLIVHFEADLFFSSQLSERTPFDLLLYNSNVDVLKEVLKIYPGLLMETDSKGLSITYNFVKHGWRSSPQARTELYEFLIAHENILSILLIENFKEQSTCQLLSTERYSNFRYVGLKNICSKAL